MQKRAKPVIKRTQKRRQRCFFLVNKIEKIDYKHIGLLMRFMTDRGKIASRRNSGVSAKWQRKLASAIKRARYMGLIPYCIE